MMNMRRIVICFALVTFLGCARIQVEAPKEAFKVDISMRVDVYQHIQKDVDSIEDLVTGGTSSSGNKSGSFLFLSVKEAYAQEALSPEVEQAALRRRDRRAQLISLERQQVLGENKSGLVEIKGPADSALSELVKEENNDRMIIYRALAAKNNTSVEEVQKLYATRIQKDAPAGTPIEVLNESTGGAYEWKIK